MITEPSPTERATPPASAGPAKPRLRGRIHQAAFLASIPAGLALVAVASTTRARLSAIVFALSVIAMYGTSAAYHRLPWSPRGGRWIKRLDHSMIFILIAGTYTPFSLLVLPSPWSLVFLWVAWAGAAGGVVLKMVRIDGFDGPTGALYITLGWLAVLAIPQIVDRLSAPDIGLLFAGGLMYTAGAIVLARHRPDPSPAVFGYHEIWHALTVGGTLCHYAFIFLIVLGSR